jgi:hypothetical protein
VRLVLFAVIASCADDVPPPPPLPSDAATDTDAAEDAGDAGRFCDGVELDDGILCTTDRCDGDRLDHLPDDGRCAHLARNPTCGTGTAAGFLMERVGICDPNQDCIFEWRPLVDCRGRSMRYCGDGVILRDEAGCIAATSTCGATTIVERDCADTLPPIHPFCDSLGFHYDGRGLCRGDPPSCTYTEQLEPCTASGPSCSGGFLTTHAAGCDPAVGCTETSTTNSCSDPSSTCAQNVLTTHEPTCTNATTCGAPTDRTTTCTGHSECSGRVYATYAPACDPIAERCGETLASSTDCAYLDDCFCNGAPPNATQQIVTGFCDPISGCDFATSPPVECPTQCRCTPTRVCN